MNIKNLAIRAAAGTVYIAVILAGLLAGKYAFAIVFGLFLCVALFEYYRIIENDERIRINKLLNIVSGVLIFLSTLYFPNYRLAAIIIYLLLQFFIALFSKNNNAFANTIYTVFGQLYITTPLLLLSMIYMNQSIMSYKIILAIFVFIWINDTAAYLVGSLFGKHKLIERISPKKTVEGFVGGIVFATLSAFIFAHFIPEYTIYFWLGFGFIASLIGTAGDLFESVIKRTYNVKDSGTLIPGHGGILDRIDSLLFATVGIYLYLFFMLAA